MKTTLSFAFLLSFIFSSYGQTSEERIQQKLDSIYTANPELVGLIVHVESPDKNVSWCGAVGYSSRKRQNKIDPSQPALIASNIKTYVSATILRLVEQDKIEINQPIKEFLSAKTRKLFESDGYQLDSITIAHLLSHTSGISGYVNKDYFQFVFDHPKYRWTRDEQTELAIKVGDPIGKPGEVFRYADMNYLLLTEIIEELTHQPFYTAMRELLKYNELALQNTWLATLEEKPAHSKPLVHQYCDRFQYDSYDQDPSWDLYGGGGIACTMTDLAKFSYHLFNMNIVKDTATLNLIYTKIDTKTPTKSEYYLGLQEYEYRTFKGYGHEGFWGTIVVYLPKLNTSIAVNVLTREQYKLYHEIIEQVIGILTAKDYTAQN